MNPIRILDPLVAERIAAGEVVERPSSVVKELVENSLDAGATEVAVLLEDGGKRLIEVLDNGRGMDPADLTLCAKRHATSKLQSLADLERIATLGFRGEALPSVAAVSDLVILSRSMSSQTWQISPRPLLSDEPGITPSIATFGHFLGSPHGTRVQARGLFSQIPARLKFLKSQGSEVAHVREWLERLAMTHPATGFRLVSDDRTILNLRPQSGADGETARVRAILSDGEDYPIVTAHGRDEGVSVRLHWLQGLSSPQTRKLVQIINHRAVKDRLVQQALLSPFRQALLPGQFPAVAVFLDVEPHTLDVNVHPTKTEVRFLQSSKIFRLIQSTVEQMIGSHGAPGFASSSSPSFGQSTGSLWTASDVQARNWAFGAIPVIPAASHEADVDMDPANSGPTPEIPMHPFAAHRFAGIVFTTYILYDLGDELGLIDQHAAHERVRFEKLRARALGGAESGWGPHVASQALLIPETVQFPAEARQLVEDRIRLLSKMGFEAEPFGEDTVVFRAIPSEWGTRDLRIRLKSLIERLIGLENPAGLSSSLVDETLFESLASEACHSSIRAGDRLDAFEAQSLVDALFRCQHPWNCPHGRPTVARVPRTRFEEWFHRKV